MQNKDGRKKENKQGQYQATILTEQTWSITIYDLLCGHNKI